MNPLPDIAPTAGDIATAHARRIRKAVNSLVAVLTTSYVDHAAAPAKTTRLKSGQQVTVTALPAVALADIQARLGASRATVDAVATALNTAPAAPPRQP